MTTTTDEALLGAALTAFGHVTSDSDASTVAELYALAVRAFGRDQAEALAQLAAQLE